MLKSKTEIRRITLFNSSQKFRSQASVKKLRKLNSEFVKAAKDNSTKTSKLIKLIANSNKGGQKPLKVTSETLKLNHTGLRRAWQEIEKSSGESAKIGQRIGSELQNRKLILNRMNMAETLLCANEAKLKEMIEHSNAEERVTIVAISKRPNTSAQENLSEGERVSIIGPQNTQPPREAPSFKSRYASTQSSSEAKPLYDSSATLRNTPDKKGVALELKGYGDETIGLKVFAGQKREIDIQFEVRGEADQMAILRRRNAIYQALKLAGISLRRLQVNSNRNIEAIA